MDSMPPNEDTDEGNSNSQDINEISINSLQSSVDNSEILENQVECNEASHKSTFKNILQAKKRLQAFSSQKQMPSSPYSKNTVKNDSLDEKPHNEKELHENLSLPKKSPMKGETSTDRAKAIIEEIEFMKKIESLQTTPTLIDDKLLYMPCKKRSRSKSSERSLLFRKREKKVRNYRRSDTCKRSPSPVISKQKKEKPTEKTSNFKFPRNWEEFKKDKWTLGKLLPKVCHSYNRNNPKDISQQLLFETPAETIKTFFYKDDRGEEILVPYQFLRYTSSKPRLSYNVNLHNVKENYLNREQILNKTNRNYKDILEKFLSRNTRTKFRTSEAIGQRNWYQKNWKDNESKVLETSIGLSFLQNYSDDDEDDEEDELTLGSSTITNSQKLRLEDEQAILDARSEVEYFEESCGSEGNTSMHKEMKMIREDAKFYDCKDVRSQASLEIDETKINEFPLSSVQELEIVRNRTESESFQEGVADKIDTSWTPERIEQTYDTMWDETPKKKKEKFITEDRKSKQRVDSNCENIEELQRAQEIHEDEWDETPKRKKDKFTLEEENIKKSKKKQNKKRSESESSSDERQKVKRKKKKLNRRKQKDKIRKAKKKKEKIKAEKLKLKKERKRKQKEKAKELVEKEILKKLKQEIEQNLEEVEREEREKEINKKDERSIDKSVKVKIEKEEDYQENVRPPEDLRNYLDKKIGKVRDLGDKFENHKELKESIKIKAVEKKTGSKAVIEIKEPINSQIKQENFSNEDRCKNMTYDIKHKTEHPEEVDVEELFPLEKETGKPCVMEENIKVNSGVIEKITAGSHIEIVEDEEATNINKLKEDLICETTPDTDEYHSNWESDDCVSSDVKMPSKKGRITWESDEELFDRTYSEKKESDSGLPCESEILEMPLHLKKFSRRRRNSKSFAGRQRSRSPTYLDVDSEIKLLEAERINLSKERMQLEMEKIRIREMEREKSMKGVEYINEPSLPPDWQPEDFRKKQNRRHSRWDLREDHVDSSTSRQKKEKMETQRSRSREKENFSLQGNDNNKSSEFSKSSQANLISNVVVSIPSSPEITSTESPKPTMLESAYQEFMRAVSTGEDSKEYLVISSAESDAPIAALDDNNSANQKKTKLTRSERDKNREKFTKKDESLEGIKVHDITDPNLLRDILLPGEVPIDEIPMPVPSPKVEILQTFPSTIVMNVVSTISVPESNSEVNTSQDSQESFGRTSDFTKKPFSFSSLVLPSKKPLLLEKSNWKLEEDSDEDAPPLKKKLEDLKDDFTNFYMVKENLGEKVFVEPKRLIGEMKETSGTIDKKHERSAEKLEKIKDKRKNNEHRGKYCEDRRKDVDDRRKDGEDKRKEDEDRKNDVEDRKKDSEDKRKLAEDKKKDFEGKRKDSEDKRKDDEDKRKLSEDRRKDDRSSRRRHSRSKTPPDAHKDKRRRDEDARRRDEDQRRKDEDARRRTEDARRKDEDTRRRDNDKRRKEDESKRRDSDNRSKEEDIKKKEDESKRRERDKKPLSPQRYRNPSPRRRRNSSPVYRKASPRHRSPLRRQDSLRRGERKSPLPLRCSPTRRKQSHSPNRHVTAIRRRSPCSKEKSPRLYHHLRRSKSPRHSPMELKRSLADSTISDDLLLQPCLREASDSPLSSSNMGSVLKKARMTLSPKRPSLDDRINQVLGVEMEPSMSWKSEETQRYFQPQETMYHAYHQQCETLLAMRPSTSMQSPITSKVVQVGNILQVVPTEEISIPPTPQFTPAQKIVQVGNMLQIVPSEMEVILPALPPPPPPTEIHPHDSTPIGITLPEKQSAEAILAAKNAERLAERAKKRREKEERKKEKDKKRKEREKKRKMQLRISTEEVIKRALEMDGLIVDDNEDLSAIVPEIISDTPGLDPSKSILSNSASRYLDPANKPERGKSVQFADGVRPGEGTSPSGGEELSSPPPQTEQLSKNKRYKKMETKRKKKRKIKVKVVKRRQSTPESDQEFENLPPPSPPPGSPPPHVFPPRVKVHTINNIPQHYLPSYGVTAAPQQQMIGQPPVINMGYPTAGGGVYRQTQQSHVNVIGQHYTRSGHSQNLGGHMHPSPHLVHPQMTTPMTHHEHQPFGSF